MRPLDRGRFAMSEENFAFIRFDGLKAPLRVGSPDIVRPLLDPILAAWPPPDGDRVPAAGAPFATLRPTGKKRWSLEAPLAEKPVALHDPVNAICDLVVEMSWERLRSQPELLCLHAAALTFGDRLVIFPNARRAGKSLLTATLARLGHRVFTDDFVPLAVDAETQRVSGIANGIAPRLRLPLPDNISASLTHWIGERIGPSNKQYGYLTGIDLPRSGTAAPVGAIVVLERDPDRAGPAELEPISRDEALAALVKQNFGRQVHAGAILAITAALTRSVPVLRLRYNGVEEAAGLLDQSEALRDLPAARVPRADHPGTGRPAPLAGLPAPETTPIGLDQVYRKQPDYTEVATETGIYLADGHGISIHRLNPVSSVIWKLLDEQMTGVDMADLLQELYPDIESERLRGDTLGALQFLAKHRLIEAER